MHSLKDCPSGRCDRTLSKVLHAISWTRLKWAVRDARKHEKCTLADEPRQGQGRMSASSPLSKQMRHSFSPMAPPRGFVSPSKGLFRVEA